MKNKKCTQNAKSSNPNSNKQQVIDDSESLLEGAKLLKENHPGLTLDQIGDLFFNKFLYRRKFIFPKK